MGLSRVVGGLQTSNRFTNHRIDERLSDGKEEEIERKGGIWTEVLRQGTPYKGV